MKVFEFRFYQEPFERGCVVATNREAAERYLSNLGMEVQEFVELTTDDLECVVIREGYGFFGFGKTITIQSNQEREIVQWFL